MNTINGNFIEKSIPNTKNATIAVNIGGVDATMTVEKFAAAIVPPATYKVYSALLTTDIIGNPPIVTVLEDTISVPGNPVTWTYNGGGGSNYSVSGPFPTLKTFPIGASWFNPMTNVLKIISAWMPADDVILFISNVTFPTPPEVILPSPSGNGFDNTPIEIRVYN